MGEQCSIVVNRHGERWSNEFGWGQHPFEIYASMLFNLPIGGRWEALPRYEPIDREQTKIVAMNNKTWELPMVLYFPASGWCFYDVVAYRNPKKGEWYVSGANPEVYAAFADMKGTPFPIVEATDRAEPFSGFVRAE